MESDVTWMPQRDEADTPLTMDSITPGRLAGVVLVTGSTLGVVVGGFAAGLLAGFLDAVEDLEEDLEEVELLPLEDDF